MLFEDMTNENKELEINCCILHNGHIIDINALSNVCEHHIHYCVMLVLGMAICAW